MIMPNRRTTTIRLIACALAVTAATGAKADDKPATDYKRVVPGIDTSTTNIGQPLHYPAGPLQITSLVVTMQPGEETGRHQHPVPTYGYILEGEITTEYEGHGSKTYKAGDTFMEAIHTWHNARATGDGPTRILAVFLGSTGVPNVIRP